MANVIQPDIDAVLNEIEEFTGALTSIQKGVVKAKHQEGYLIGLASMAGSNKAYPSIRFKTGTVIIDEGGYRQFASLKSQTVLPSLIDEENNLHKSWRRQLEKTAA